MAVERVHRAAYGINYEARKVNYGPVQLQVLSDNAEQEISLIFDRLEDDKEAMGTISEMMAEFVRGNIRSASGPALLPETIERKKRGGWSTATLQKTGSLLAGINARSRKHYAAAVRDKGTGSGPTRSLPFAFLHDYGVGRYEQHEFMVMSSAQIEQVFGVYDRFVDEALNAQ